MNASYLALCPPAFTPSGIFLSLQLSLAEQFSVFYNQINIVGEITPGSDFFLDISDLTWKDNRSLKYCVLFEDFSNSHIQLQKFILLQGEIFQFGKIS